MSGGHFNYIQYRVTEAADGVERYIARCEGTETDEWGYKPELPDDILEKFKLCQRMLKLAGDMLHRCDWLASGDDGEDSFRRRWVEDGLPEKCIEVFGGDGEHRK